MAPDDDRDKRNTIRPPASVQAQIAQPLKKSRAETPVHGIEFDDPTGVTPIPRGPETPMERMQRQSAEIKNLNIAQSEELSRLRSQQDQMFELMITAKKAELEEKAKRAAAWRDFFVKLGIAIVAAVVGALALLKSGCGE